MASTKELTGGTGDVNPQILTFTVTQTGADVNTEAEVPLPIPRYTAKNNRAIVLEVLRCDVFLADLNDSGVANFVQAFLKTRTGAQITDPETFVRSSYDFLWGTSVGFIYVSRVQTFDLTDGAGHGLLIGTDSLFGNCNSVVTGLTNTVNFKLWYRYKEVSLQEYIGIVQSQQ